MYKSYDKDGKQEFSNQTTYNDNDYVEKCVEFLENNSDYSMVSPSSILYPYNYFDFAKKIGKKCKVVKRKGKVRVICENPKHKQRHG